MLLKSDIKIKVSLGLLVLMILTATLGLAAAQQHKLAETTECGKSTAMKNGPFELVFAKLPQEKPDTTAEDNSPDEAVTVCNQLPRECFRMELLSINKNLFCGKILCKNTVVLRE